MKKTVQMILLMALVAFSNGCSSKKAEEPVAPPVVSDVPVTPGGTGAGTTSCGSSTSSGNSVCLSVVSFSEFSNYVATHPLNDPSNIRLTVELSDVGSGRYGGTVRIAYTDNGQPFEGVFRADSGTNSNISGSNGWNGYSKSEFNRWFTYQGRSVFSGFFQDSYGAIVLVIESVLNTGDGSGGGYVNGSIWFSNFAQSLAPYNNTQRQCWFLSNGPYNCQSETVMNKSDLYPSNGYRKLGTFTGLMKSAAFGN